MQTAFEADTFIEQVITLTVDGLQVFACETAPQAAVPVHPVVVLFLPGLNRNGLGPQRLFVTMSRAFAHQGMYALRISWPSSIYSEGYTIEAESESWSIKAVNVALAYLRDRFGTCNVVVIGMCWGAQMGLTIYSTDTVIDSVIALSPAYPLSTRLKQPSGDGRILFIFGEGDPIYVDSIDGFRQECQDGRLNARFVILPNTGHAFASYWALKRVKELCWDFLSDKISS